MSNASIRRRVAWLAGGTLYLLSQAVAAQTPPYSLIPQGAQLWSSMGLWGGGVTKQVVTVPDPPQGASSAQVLRIRVLTEPASPYADAEWSRGIAVNTVASVARGDLILIRFWRRAAEPAGGSAYTRFMLEKNGPDYNKLISFPVSCGPVWEKVERVCWGQDYAAGGLHVVFYLGYSPETFEIAELSVTNYGSNVRPSDLGVVADTYQGRELDAAWRAAATERIDRYRRANLTIEVKDSAGRPVPAATVEVRMRRHEFGFGSAVAAAMLTGTSNDARIYQEAVARLYNKVVFENDLKWKEWGWENLTNRPVTLQALDWLRARNIAVRGHCLVWPSWGNMPADARYLTGEALRDRIRTHIWDEAGHPQLRDGLAEWDVLNEPYSNHDVMDLLGEQEMGSWFEWAHQADPDARLYINDYDILEAEGADGKHQQHYWQTIDYLKNTLQAPIHGIGLQSHFSGQLTPPERLYEVLERFAALGLTLQATEFDIDSANEELQADYLRDFMTILFSHPSVAGVLMWGFWEGHHWRPAAALYRRDWTPKPHGLMWENLVFTEWWTNADLLTDSQGRARLRGFKGDYVVRVGAYGQVLSRELRLTGDQTVVFEISHQAAPKRRRR